ncbi:MAG TPA: tRNA (guanosine(37)-N1)-methyltransferase TrmD [Patescibacteria group bacterium]
MEFSLITLFPKVFSPFLNESIVKRARKKGLVSINLVNLRDFAKDKHKTVDDKPFGGGAGMVLKVDVLFEAIKSVKEKIGRGKVILLSPQGKTLNQQMVKRLSKEDHLILISGHYEGFDERIKEFIDEEVSIGDYVLTGGELPALVVIDAVTRLVPGVLSKSASHKTDTFEGGLLKYPQYTRPEEFRSLKVPGVLLSGNHKKIDEWRKEQSLKKTKSLRPDLFEK